MREAAKKEMVVSIPDFDTLNISNARDLDDEDDVDSPVKTKKKESSVSSDFKSAMSDLQLGEILNLFQGDIPLNNLVTVMSTNCIEYVDKALLRRGRTDLLIELGHLGYNEINAFYKYHYELTTDLPDGFKTIKIKACDMQAAFEDYPFDSQKYVNEIKRFIK